MGTPLRLVAVHAVIVWIAIARAAAAPVCERAVRVSGDAAAAAEVRTRLADRGVVDGADGCTPVRAKVDRRGDGLRIEVVDRSGRRSQRDVRDAATAVALIESWIEPEVVAGEELPGVPTDAAPPVVRAGARAPVSGIAVGFGAARADDDSTWLVGGVAACGMIGPVCLGGRAELARDVTTEFHARQIVTGAVTVEVAWRLGPFAIVPGVAIGPSWNRVGGNGPHMDQTADDASLRLGGGIAVQRAVTGGWAIELAVTGDGAVTGGGPGLYRAAVALRRGWW